MSEILIYPFDWQERTILYNNGSCGNEIQTWALTSEQVKLETLTSNKNANELESEKVFVRVVGFPILCEMELPEKLGYSRSNINWDSKHVDSLINGYKAMLKNSIERYNTGYAVEHERPLKTMPNLLTYSFHSGRSFYYYQPNEKPFLKLFFQTKEDMFTFINPLHSKEKDVGYEKTVCLEECKLLFGNAWFPLKIHETTISATKKYLTQIRGNFTGWFRLNQFTLCTGEPTSAVPKLAKDKYKEYMVPWNQIVFVPNDKSIPKARFMSFDIETFSDKDGEFPNEICVNHVVYMISCVSENVGEPEKRKRTLLTIGNCPVSRYVEQNKEGLDKNQGKVKFTEPEQVICCTDEEDLILKFIDYIEDDDPDILMGYNTLQFDWKYIQMRIRKIIHPWTNPWAKCSRMKLFKPESDVCIHDKNKYIHECNKCSIAPFKKKEMNSSGRGENVYTGVDIVGRLSMIDMMVIIKTDYKLAHYNLNFVSQTYLDEGKHDISAGEMFKIFENLQNATRAYNKAKNELIKCVITLEDFQKLKLDLIKAENEYARVGLYCVQDSELVNRLFVLHNSWIWLSTQGGIYNVNPQNVYLYGQQKRGISLLYEECVRSNIVMTERKPVVMNYTGGYVSEPHRGIHYVFCLDFNSLYPNSGRRYNIDFTTLLTRKMTMYIAMEFCMRRNIKCTFDCQKCHEANSTGENIVCTTHEIHIIKSLLDSVPVYGELEHPALEIAIWLEEIKIDKTLSAPVQYNENGKKAKNKKNVVKEERYNLFMFKKPYERTNSQGEKYLEVGIFPRIAARLIGERKAVRARQVGLPKDSMAYIMLEQEQLTLKMAANSLYGFLGRKAGGFLFPEGAASITHYGRYNIKKLARHLEAHYKEEEAVVVYGDTDSVMVALNKMKGKTDDERENRRLLVARKKEFEAVANQINIDPMHAEFEKAMLMVLFNKKMYAYYKIDDKGDFIMETYSEKDPNTGKVVYKPSIRDKGFFKGQHLENMEKKGIPLARREDDFFKLDTYEAVLRKMISGSSREELKQIMMEQILKLLTKQYPMEDLTMISSVRSHYQDDTNKLKVFSEHRSAIGKPIVGGERYNLVVMMPKDSQIPSKKMKVGVKLRGIDELESNQLKEVPDVIDHLYYIEKSKRVNETYCLLFKHAIAQQLALYEVNDRIHYLENYAISLILILGDYMQYKETVREQHITLFKMRKLVKTEPQKIIDFAMSMKGCKGKTEDIGRMVKKRFDIRYKYALRETSEPIFQIYKLVQCKEKLMKEIKSLNNGVEPNVDLNNKDKETMVKPERKKYKYPLHFFISGYDFINNKESHFKSNMAYVNGNYYNL